MKKSIIIASCLLIAVSCNLLDKDDDNDPPTPPPTEPGVTDVALSEVNIPETIVAGSVASIDVTVENVGSENVSESFLVILTNETTEANLDTVEVESLTSSATENIVLEWNTVTAPLGENDVAVYHTLSDDNADNDQQSQTVVISDEEENGNGEEPSSNDVAITNFTAPDSATVGEEVSVEVTVENAGDSTVTDEFTVTLTNSNDATEIGSEVVSSLEAGASENLTFTWNTAGLTAADYEINVSHDYADDNAENDESSAIITLSDDSGEDNGDGNGEDPDPTVDADLIISNFETPQNTVTDGVIYVTRGDTVFFDVTVENSGPENITEDIPVTIYHHGNAEGTASITGGLDSGSSATVTVEWLTENQTTGAPPHPLEITTEFSDSDETSNVANAQAQVDLPEEEA